MATSRVLIVAGDDHCRTEDEGDWRVCSKFLDRVLRASAGCTVPPLVTVFEVIAAQMDHRTAAVALRCRRFMPRSWVRKAVRRFGTLAVSGWTDALAGTGTHEPIAIYNNLRDFTHAHAKAAAEVALIGQHHSLYPVLEAPGANVAKARTRRMGVVSFMAPSSIALAGFHPMVDVMVKSYMQATPSPGQYAWSLPPREAACNFAATALLDAGVVPFLARAVSFDWADCEDHGGVRVSALSMERVYPPVMLGFAGITAGMNENTRSAHVLLGRDPVIAKRVRLQVLYAVAALYLHRGIMHLDPTMKNVMVRLHKTGTVGRVLRLTPTHSYLCLPIVEKGPYMFACLIDFSMSRSYELFQDDANRGTFTPTGGKLRNSGRDWWTNLAGTASMLGLTPPAVPGDVVDMKDTREDIDVSPKARFARRRTRVRVFMDALLAVDGNADLLEPALPAAEAVTATPMDLCVEEGVPVPDCTRAADEVDDEDDDAGLRQKVQRGVMPTFVL